MGLDVSSVSDTLLFLSALLFIFSLGGLSQQETAKRGNVFGIFGMAIAIFVSLFDPSFGNGYWFLLVFGTGGGIGLVLALRVEMTSMPQLVALLHSFVGIAAVLVGMCNAVSHEHVKENEVLHRIEIFVGIWIGCLTFTGSLIAAGKLEGTLSSDALQLKGRHVINALIVIGSILLGADYCSRHGTDGLIDIYLMLVLSGILGFHLVLSIGGGDMPVVVSMLNSYSGWATAASGFMLNSYVLIIAGSLIGSSGAVLSYIMCKAMNRSFISVILGGIVSTEGFVHSKGADEMDEAVRVDVDQVAKFMKDAKNIIIVPGYGMAVARCQNDLTAIVQKLRGWGKTVRFCIHPVAGRLPGHMNVLLAEARCPYDIVLELDEINEDFKSTDLVLVVGANDTVNPIALDPRSPIGGMPVCHVWDAKRVVVMKRSLAQGYAAIDNPLFYRKNSVMLLGDAKDTVTKLLASVLGGAPGAATASSSSSSASSSSSSSKSSSSKESTFRSLTAEHELAKTAVVIQGEKILGVPRECKLNEARVSVTPALVREFQKLAFTVHVEEGAGLGSGYDDDSYRAAGARLVSRQQLWSESDVIVKFNAPMALNGGGGKGKKDAKHEVELLSSDKPQILVSFISPVVNRPLLDKLVAQNPRLTVLAMDCVPRTTRAQKIDALSSQAGIAGHRAVIEAARLYQRFFQGTITAAGKYPPARVLIIGAGVAGLSALGTAKGLGAEVRVFDTRSVCKEQTESMGGVFLTVDLQEEGAGAGGYAKESSPEFIAAEMKLFAEQAAEVDIIITTANIPNRPAPKLILDTTVRLMRAGSVIVDLAAENGGNTMLTKAGETFTDPESGVIIVGTTHFPSLMADQASTLYANNLKHLLVELGGATKLNIDLQNDIIGPATVIKDGKITHGAPTPATPSPSPPPSVGNPLPSPPAVSHSVQHPTNVHSPSGGESASKPKETDRLLGDAKSSYQSGGSVAVDVSDDSAEPEASSAVMPWVWLALELSFLLGFFIFIGEFTPPSFHLELLVFVLSVVLGFHVINAVTAALHTPLMAVTNALSGVIIVGLMLQTHGSTSEASVILALVGSAFASINIVGGFAVTQKMLQMFTTGR